MLTLGLLGALGKGSRLAFLLLLFFFGMLEVLRGFVAFFFLKKLILFTLFVTFSEPFSFTRKELVWFLLLFLGLK